MNRWVLSAAVAVVFLVIMSTLIVLTKPSLNLKSLADANENSLITINKLTGENAELFLASVKEFCDVNEKVLYRLQIVSEDKTITKVLDKNSVELCEVNSDDPDYVEKSVAILVNSEPIYLNEILELLNKLPETLRAEGTNDVVNILVNQKLWLQEAINRGITSSDKLKVVQEQVLQTANVEVTELDLKNYYDENKASLILPESFNIRHIQINFNQNPETTLQKAETVFSLLNTTDFCTLVTQFSEDTSSLDSCGRHTFLVGQMLPGIEQEVKLMIPNQVKIIKSGLGYHILELESKTNERQASYEEVENSIRNFLILEKQQIILQDYLDNLRKKAEIISYIS